MVPRINRFIIALAVLLTALVILSTSGASQPAIGEDQVLVEYYLDPTCQECNIAHPYVEELAESYGEQVVFVTITLLTPEDFSEMFSLGIYNTPAVVIEKQVKLVYGQDFGDDIEEMVAVIRSAIDDMLSRDSPLSIQRSIDPVTVVPGGTVNVTVTLVNDGDYELQNLTAVDIIMEGTALVAGPAGWVGNIDPGANATYAYTLRIDLPDGTYNLTATNVTYSENDIDRAAVGYSTTILVSPELSPVMVFGAGFLAGFNPCLLAILAFIASISIATSGRRRDVVVLVVVFSLGIFITYLLSGLGLLYAVESAPEIQATITTILVAGIGFLGIWHLVDTYYIMRSDKTSFYTPKTIGRLLKNVTRARNLPIVFALGALFSLIKAPCVGAVYFAVLDLIISHGELGSGFSYLAIYNLGVIIPVIVLGLGIAFGLPPDRVEAFRLHRRALTRFITGVTLVLVALLLVFPAQWAPLLLGTLGFGVAFPPEVLKSFRENHWAKLLIVSGITLIALAIAWVILQ